MAQNPPKNLSQLVFEETKQFQQKFITQYNQLFQQYQLKTYKNLLNCYSTHMTKESMQSLDSRSMLKYFDCYKGIMREARVVNKRVYEESVDIDRQLKHCIEVKSNFSKSVNEYQQNKVECLESYRDKYHSLYKDIFEEGTIQKKEQ